MMLPTVPAYNLVNNSTVSTSSTEKLVEEECRACQLYLKLLLIWPNLFLTLARRKKAYFMYLNTIVGIRVIICYEKQQVGAYCYICLYFIKF